jgi:hypothetical protein
MEHWFRFGGWMVVAVDPGDAYWAYLDVPGHDPDPEIWRGIIDDGDDLPEDWEPTGTRLSQVAP